MTNLGNTISTDQSARRQPSEQAGLRQDSTTPSNAETPLKKNSSVAESSKIDADLKNGSERRTFSHNDENKNTDVVEEIVSEHDLPDRKDLDGASSADGENMNVRAAIVHMMGDMIQSIGVISAALIIYFKPEWKIADPICTFLFSILVMFTTVPIFKDCMSILMESSPDDVEVLELYNAILKVSDHLRQP